MTDAESWAGLTVSTVYEASGRSGLLDPEIFRVVPSTAAVGRARTVLCEQDDNLGVHIAIDDLQAGEILVATMPEPRPVALIGEVLARFAKARGAAGLLIDAAIRDFDELVILGLPVWSRWITSSGAAKRFAGKHNVPVSVAGQTINPGEMLILDGDGILRLRAEDEADALLAAKKRLSQEEEMMAELDEGKSTLDLMDLRDLVERTDLEET
ncbi:MAG: dimethylmenaquinone methyltransferase [Acidimicrobiaceae bacterium]|nr:dimethylmenaquinone methyltransferase [Acidimicrobiaceae bacterium]HAQ23086.1 dimethylmenaquinone methyltransferase [Acidimicrobiaceae bacterium]